VQLDRRLVESRRKMKLAEDILKWTWSNTQVTIGEIPIFFSLFYFLRRESIPHYMEKDVAWQKCN
jgi:hypothetical protein